MDGSPPPALICLPSKATPQQMLDLAGVYAGAAEDLIARKKKGLNQLPARHCALHAMELYLHAFLRFRGATPGQIKGRQHNLWHPEFAERLGLDDKTCDHLKRLSDSREYVAARYAPDRLADQSPHSRLIQTLSKIREAADRIPFSP